MFTLRKKGFNAADIPSYGNMFLIGNGHLGYRGTLEEYTKKEMTSLNVVGFYDRFGDSWRESINMPNPFFIHLEDQENSYSVLDKEPNSHLVSLDLKRATFKRQTIYPKLVISSSRFITQGKNILALNYLVKAKEDVSLEVTLGVDADIFEINGPHFRNINFENEDKEIIFTGLSNENKKVSLVSDYFFDVKDFEILNKDNKCLFHFRKFLRKGQVLRIRILAKVIELWRGEPEEKSLFTRKDYSLLRNDHETNMNHLWENSYVTIKGDKKAQEAVLYSIYHLLILANDKYDTSIPARGVSGSTYKGAIFWDSEIFLLPFYLMTNKKVARSLINYRIKTLEGALAKAKEFGYQGAFYAWESQETGLEACSKYNVTDVFTGQKVRTYFNEKQIHISADISYAIDEYLKWTGDDSILKAGAMKVLTEVAKFFVSYKVENKGQYFINDVIGPDEYHERVNNNAFTNYMAYEAVSIALKYWNEGYQEEEKENLKLLKESFIDFLAKLYLPKENKDLIIPQFDGYFDLEDASLEAVRSRLRHPNEYWGSKNGVATHTRIIKQADVVTLMVLLEDRFSLSLKKANFDYYNPRTEHGSSLSASMYSILAAMIGRVDEAYTMFYKSASIDLGTNQKNWAGGIYIGGTHPAAAGGTYLSLLKGIAGLRVQNDRLIANPQLFKKWHYLSFKFNFRDKLYLMEIFKDNSYKIKEVV